MHFHLVHKQAYKSLSEKRNIATDCAIAETSDQYEKDSISEFTLRFGERSSDLSWDESENGSTVACLESALV